MVLQVRDLLINPNFDDKIKDGDVQCEDYEECKRSVDEHATYEKVEEHQVRILVLFCR